jgi:hypothetical protein
VICNGAPLMSRYSAATTVASVAVFLLAAGCSTVERPRTDGQEARTVDEALKDAEIGDVVRIQSRMLVWRDEARLCDQSAGDSIPNYCGELDSLLVQGVPLDELDLVEQGDTGALEGNVDVVVRFVDEKLVDFVEDASAADEPTSSSSAVLEPTSIREALASVVPGEQVRVQAVLVTEDDVPFLCDSVEDSDPEQCSEPSVEIVGAPLDDLGLTERRGELAGEVDIVITLEGKTATYVGLGTGSETTTREP